MLFKILRRTVEANSSEVAQEFVVEKPSNPSLSISGLIHMVRAKDRMLKETAYMQSHRKKGIRVIKNRAAPGQSQAKKVNAPSRPSFTAKKISRRRPKVQRSPSVAPLQFFAPGRTLKTILEEKSPVGTPKTPKSPGKVAFTFDKQASSPEKLTKPLKKPVNPPKTVKEKQPTFKKEGTLKTLGFFMFFFVLKAHRKQIVINNILKSYNSEEKILLPPFQKKYPVDFDDELKIGDVRYDDMTKITIKVQLF